MDSKSLPPETARFWHWLEPQPALAGFTLIGGTALALHLGHRVSEDLDFVTHTPRLPVPRLRALRTLAGEAGFEWRENHDPNAEDEFAIAGMNLTDYQQDYVVNDQVRLTFFTADDPLARLLPENDSSLVRVASLKDLFNSKAILTSQRSRSRDWLDLYLLMTRHGFQSHDFLEAFAKAGIPRHWEISLQRMTSGHLPAHDPGYQHLLSDPPALETMNSYFRTMRDSIEQTRAREQLHRPPATPDK